MWKCKNCGKISKRNLFESGYCKYCKKYHVLERFDTKKDIDEKITLKITGVKKVNNNILKITFLK